MENNNKNRNANSELLKALFYNIDVGNSLNDIVGDTTLNTIPVNKFGKDFDWLIETINYIIKLNKIFDGIKLSLFDSVNYKERKITCSRSIYEKIVATIEDIKLHDKSSTQDNISFYIDETFMTKAIFQILNSPNSEELQELLEIYLNELKKGQVVMKFLVDISEFAYEVTG